MTNKSELEQEPQASAFPPILGVDEFDKKIKEDPTLINDFAGVCSLSYQKILEDNKGGEIKISPYGELEEINIDTLGVVHDFRGKEFDTSDYDILESNRSHGSDWSIIRALIDLDLANSYQEAKSIWDYYNEYFVYLATISKHPGFLDRTINVGSEINALTMKSEFIRKVCGSKEKNDQLLKVLKNNGGVQIILGKPNEFIAWLKTINYYINDDYAITINESLPSKFVSMLVALGERDKVELRRQLKQ